MPTHLIIVNPTAGRGAAAQAVPVVTRMLGEYGLSFDLVETRGPWHAAELAQQAASSGYGVVVAMGGDGTSNEVINGLMESQRAGEGEAALGVLCVGTGNDFAYGLGIPADLAAGCAVLARGQTRTVDVGRARGLRYFGNGIGVGFDAAANAQASRIARLRGFALYLVAVLRTLLFYYRAPLTRIELDNGVLEQPALMVSIMNGRRMGGGFVMTPNSSPDDGLFDLCIARKMSQLQMLSFIPDFLRGTHVGRRPITMARSRHVEVTVKEGTQIVHADGETLSLEVDRLELELLPQRLRVVC